MQILYSLVSMVALKMASVSVVGHFCYLVPSFLPCSSTVRPQSRIKIPPLFIFLSTSPFSLSLSLSQSSTAKGGGYNRRAEWVSEEDLFRENHVQGENSEHCLSSTREWYVKIRKKLQARFVLAVST